MVNTVNDGSNAPYGKTQPFQMAIIGQVHSPAVVTHPAAAEAALDISSVRVAAAATSVKVGGVATHPPCLMASNPPQHRGTRKEDGAQDGKGRGTVK